MNEISWWIMMSWMVKCIDCNVNVQWIIICRLVELPTLFSCASKNITLVKYSKYNLVAKRVRSRHLCSQKLILSRCPEIVVKLETSEQKPSESENCPMQMNYDGPVTVWMVELPVLVINQAKCIMLISEPVRDLNERWSVSECINTILTMRETRF